MYVGLYVQLCLKQICDAVFEYPSRLTICVCCPWPSYLVSNLHTFFISLRALQNLVSRLQQMLIHHYLAFLFSCITCVGLRADNFQTGFSLLRFVSPLHFGLPRKSDSSISSCLHQHTFRAIRARGHRILSGSGLGEGLSVATPYFATSFKTGWITGVSALETF